ncbi:transposase [Nocardia gamkensis]|uniref:IS110 family transposase n=1 Tax=Nocardia gamkensis TaxID=352869 RepID=UPI0037CA10E6
MIVIGIDPHKGSHTATAVDPAGNTDLGSIRIEATLAEYKRLIAWAKPWPQRRWAVENADGFGRQLSRGLIARGEVVVDVPATATARVRELSRGGRRKNDRIDAAAAAYVAALQGDCGRSSPTSMLTRSGCWTSAETICPATGLARSISFMRCCENCSPVARPPA